MDNNLYKKSYAFAIRVVKFYQFLSDEKREFILSKQMLRSGTSIGANIADELAKILYTILSKTRKKDDTVGTVDTDTLFTV